MIVRCLPIGQRRITVLLMQHASSVQNDRNWPDACRFMGITEVPATQPMRERSTWSNLMPAPIACHRCAVLPTREQDGDAIKISYDYSVWSR